MHFPVSDGHYWNPGDNIAAWYINHMLLTLDFNSINITSSHIRETFREQK